MNQDQAPKRLLDFKSGGWVLALSAVLCIGVVFWSMFIVGGGGGRIGDGRHLDSYGFDLSTLTVPRENMTATIRKDGIRALVDVEFTTREKLLGSSLRALRKYLVASDRVIGVTLAGVARAYPIRVLNWHEIVNDTIAQTPVAVTYHPLCGSSVVFDRRVGGEVLEFGVSGLLYNSNLLMYDRRTRPEDESLWSQLLFRAVAGPAAAASRTLRVLDAKLVTWGEWNEMHPETTVLMPDLTYSKLYKRAPYSTYRASDDMRYPVSPLPDIDPDLYKTPAIVALAGDGSLAIVQDTICQTPGEAWTQDWRGRALRLHCKDNDTVLAEANGDIVFIYVYRFAWYAMYPDGEWFGA